MSSADGTERGQKPKALKAGPGFARDEVKPHVANRRSVNGIARSRRLRGSLECSEAERRGAMRPGDQAESERKRLSGQASAQREWDSAEPQS